MLTETLPCETVLMDYLITLYANRHNKMVNILTPNREWQHVLTIVQYPIQYLSSIDAQVYHYCILQKPQY